MSVPEQTTPPRVLSVIMPVYNEAAHVEEAIRRLRLGALPFDLDRQIVIVDDGSTDDTGAILARLTDNQPGMMLLRHPRNLGKGAAIATALQRATGDIILIHDADLEYDPRDHAEAIRPIMDGRADVVIGSRFLGQTHRVLYYWHSVANRFITTLSNMFTNLNLTDIECCTKAFRRDVLEQIHIQEQRFGVEPELIAKVAKLRTEDGRRLRVFEVPVSYAGRTYEEGKKITWRDGIIAIGCILRYNLL